MTVFVRDQGKNILIIFGDIVVYMQIYIWILIMIRIHKKVSHINISLTINKFNSLKLIIPK